jgi:hypothetical protein
MYRQSLVKAEHRATAAMLGVILTLGGQGAKGDETYVRRLEPIRQAIAPAAVRLGNPAYTPKC